jgi:metallo-beta-lactamase family protein
MKAGKPQALKLIAIGRRGDVRAPGATCRYSVWMPLITFLGAARTVTGSKHLVEAGEHRVLVDCGLFQGSYELRRRNWNDLPVAAASIDAVVLTHAHLDHVGYLPRLVSQGFKGRVFCTPGTKDLASLVLIDSAHLQEEDARDANAGGYSRHHPARPLYSVADAWAALALLQPVGFDRPVPVAPGMEVSFVPVGHLLGAAAGVMHVTDPARTLVFGGDLGRYGRPVLPDPRPVAKADILLCESTYGDRLHDPDDGGARLAGIVTDTIGKGGKLIIPSFAIGRVEEVLYWLRRLESEGRIPVVPVYVDSPMAIEALRFYANRTEELDPEYRGNGRRLEAFSTRRFECVSSGRQSMDLVRSDRPAIVISSSGMATGGRVLHHLERVLPDPKHTVLFVGYQAAGTRGRSLVDGAKVVKMLGRMVPVAARIESLDSMSAHADQSEILRWLGGFSAPPAHTFIVHGEPLAQDVLIQRIADQLGWASHAPDYGERAEV